MGIPARPPGRKAVGILLAPTTGRIAAFTIIGVPLILFLILGFKTAGGGSSTPTYGSQDQYPGQGGGSTQQAYPYSSPSYPADSTDSGLSASTDSSYDYPPTADSASATDTSTATATATASSSASPSPSATGPAAVVLAAYADINKHDYQDAYNLGLAQNGQDYSTFVQGYSTTQSDTITVTGVNGDVVSVSLLAVRTDGTQSTYSGTYTVSGGVITGASLQQVN